MSIEGEERIRWKQKYGSISYTCLCTNKTVCIATNDGPFTISDASNQEKVFAEGDSCFVFEYTILPVIESYY